MALSGSLIFSMMTTSAMSSSTTFPIPPFELILQVSRQVQEALLVACPERRAEARNLMVVPVLVQPVDESFEPLAPPFGAVTRNISPQGIGLVHTLPIEYELLALQLKLGDEDINLVAKVLWCELERPAFYYIGCELVAKLEGPPLFDCEDSRPSEDHRIFAANLITPKSTPVRPYSESVASAHLPSTFR